MKWGKLWDYDIFTGRPVQQLSVKQELFIASFALAVMPSLGLLWYSMNDKPQLNIMQFGCRSYTHPS